MGCDDAQRSSEGSIASPDSLSRSVSEASYNVLLDNDNDDTCYSPKLDYMTIRDSSIPGVIGSLAAAVLMDLASESRCLLEDFYFHHMTDNSISLGSRV